MRESESLELPPLIDDNTAGKICVSRCGIYGDLDEDGCVRVLGAAQRYRHVFSNIRKGGRNSASRLMSVLWNHNVHINNALSE